MNYRIETVYFADDDEDDHDFFGIAMAEVDSTVQVVHFLACDILLKSLHDPEQKLPDIIFLDFNMPGNDGYQCLKEIKQSARMMHIPVVMYSTAAEGDHIKYFYEYGAFKYIQKPHTLPEISRRLKNVLEEVQNHKNGLT